LLRVRLVLSAALVKQAFKRWLVITMSDYLDPKYFKKSTYSAVNIIIGQFVAGVICLVLGLGFISFMTKLPTLWDIHDYALLSDPFLYALGLFLLIPIVTATQVDKALANADLFRFSIKMSFYGGSAIVVLMGFGAALIIYEALTLFLLVMFLVGWVYFDKAPKMPSLWRLILNIIVYGSLFIAISTGFLILLSDVNLKWLLIEIIYDLTLATSLGFIVGSVQIARTRIENFNPIKHKWLMSNTADLYACQIGVLPYRQKITNFWDAFILFIIVLVLIFVMFGLVMINSVDKVFLLLIALFVLAMFYFIKYVRLLFSPAIKHIEGNPTKTYRRLRHNRKEFNLTCNGFNFSTNSQTWQGIEQGEKYRLWYSSVNNNVMAFEQVVTSTSSFLDDTISIKNTEKRKQHYRNVSNSIKWVEYLNNADNS
jgi:hypothetical protein